MKKILTIAALAAGLAVSTPALAGPYVSLGGEFQSVSVRGVGIPPDFLSGPAVEAGWRLGKVSLGGEYSRLTGTKEGTSFSANRYGVVAAYHFPLIRGLDTDLHADVGRTSYDASEARYLKGVVPLFHGSSTDFGVGLGAAVPVWRALSIKASGGYRSSDFAGRGNGGPVFGLSLVLGR